MKMPDKSSLAVGDSFGRWTLISRAHVHKSRQQWECRCKCGVIRCVDEFNLRYGASKSCGCLKPGPVRHGDSRNGNRAAEYAAWCHMKSRCTNPRAKKYADYGGRGIRVCDRWLYSYETFLSDMGRRPSPKHSLDRKDVNGDYTPENCRWATHYDQMMNKRRHISAKFKGIWFSKAAGLWMATITKDRKRSYLGSFALPEQAAAAYAAAARELYGQ